MAQHTEFVTPSAWAHQETDAALMPGRTISHPDGGAVNNLGVYTLIVTLNRIFLPPHPLEGQRHLRSGLLPPCSRPVTKD